MTGATLPEEGAAVRSMGWFGILRMGVVQAALGCVVVLVTSTLNRVMVVEYALPAMLPGVLVALHYAIQMVRPRLGYGSDQGSRRTPWIVGGMAVLAGGGMVCALATVLMRTHFLAALLLAVAGYSLVGLGVGAAGTSLLVLVAHRVDDGRRAAAATLMWTLMIAGFAITSTTVGHYLDPFSPARLMRVTAIAVCTALLLAVAALWNVEGQAGSRAAARGAARPGDRPAFGTSLRRVWQEPEARSFTLFVFVSMLAYSAEELLLEPFCGLVFGYSLGDSARMSGSWHAAAFVGMVTVGIAGSGARRFGSLRHWTIGGCCASALAVLGLAAAGVVGPAWPLRPCVLLLGAANGVFAVAAIGSMMELAHRGEPHSAGTRMGLWGAAQAVAFALGGFFGTALIDVLRWLSGSATAAFAAVFVLETLLFFAAARLAARTHSPGRAAASHLPAVTA